MIVHVQQVENLDKIKASFKKDGLNNLHILADFDRTLTYGAIDGVKTPSIISMLRDGKHLTSDYAAKAHALFDKYHPIELDSHIDIVEKKKFMQEWWTKHEELLLDSGLTKMDLQDIVDNGHVKFRDGVSECLDFLHAHSIPLVVISAGGCGDAIQLFFQKINKDYDNIFYVTNKFVWDKDGKALKNNGPIIHCMNKDETILSEIPEVFEVIQNRKNVMLLGDSLSDLAMVDGFDYINLLKIGFLNFDYNKSREDYLDNFDVVLEGDGDFDFVTNFLKDLKN